MSRPASASQSRLATDLRELRATARLGGIEAGRRAGISQSKISKIENQAIRPSPDDVRVLCQVYGASPEQRNELIRLAESLRNQITEPRRVTLSRGAHQMQQQIRKLEISSSLLRSYQPCMIIGLLQTEAYARLVFAASSTGPDIDKAVTARLERQAALRDQAQQAILIMTEGALRWQAGSPSVMVQQLDAIAHAAELPNVQIGVIPYTTPVTVFPRHGFHLYDSDAAIIGTETGTATIIDDDDIIAYEQLFTRLHQLAATGRTAQDELTRIADDYKKM